MHHLRATGRDLHAAPHLGRLIGDVDESDVAASLGGRTVLGEAVEHPAAGRLEGSPRLVRRSGCCEAAELIAKRDPPGPAAIGWIDVHAYG
jgi:hypothetical protein